MYYARKKFVGLASKWWRKTEAFVVTMIDIRLSISKETHSSIVITPGVAHPSSQHWARSDAARWDIVGRGGGWDGTRE